MSYDTTVSFSLSFFDAGDNARFASLRGETFELESSGCARKFNIFQGVSDNSLTHIHNSRTQESREATEATSRSMEGYRRPRPVSGSVPTDSLSSVSDSRPRPLSTSRESMAIICELSDLLQTGLSRDALVAVVDLLECGLSPEVVAAAVLEIRREVSSGVTTSGVGG